MSIIRKAQKNKFTAVSNALIAGSGLSFACRGMLVYLLSKPDDWQCLVTDLEREGNIGETARRTIMREAEEKGFLTFERMRGEDGRFAGAYLVHEEALPEDQRTRSWENQTRKSRGGESRAGESAPGSAPPGKPGGILNTDILNTEKEYMSSCYATSTAKSEVSDTQALKPETEEGPKPDSSVREIFDYWRNTLAHKKAKLTPDRAAKIKARLREGYTVEQCKRAIDGCGSSAFHRGENDSGTLYDSIDLIFRNGSKLESFIVKTQRLKPDLSQPADEKGYGKDKNGRATYHGRLIVI